MSTETHFTKHQRVESATTIGMRGTVRFCGIVDHSPDKGTYIGVEWDGTEQGKYDGEIFGVRYFTANKLSSSFVKPVKITSGIELCEFLITKYTLAEQHTKRLASLTDEAKPTKGLTNVISHQSVYRDDDGTFPNIKNVSASGSLSSRCGRVGYFFPNLTDLSLSYTLMSSWKEVFSVFSSLKKLETISISGNQMEPLSEYFAIEPNVSETFPTVTSLSLTSMNIEWDAVIHLVSRLPCLTELNCSDNSHTETPLDENIAPKLSRLRLDNNKVSCWKTVVSSLSGLKSLKYLHLSDNPIKCITADYNNDNTSSLNLKGLFLRKTKLSSWEDVDNLALLSVSELCLSGCPLTDKLKDHERRCLITARIPTITTLNRGVITPSERIDCERFLVRYYHGIQEPPMIWNKLVEIHGTLLPLAEIDISPNLTAAITVQYIYSENVDCSPYVVNVKQTVENLTRSLCSPFGINPNRVSLIKVDPEVANTPLERSSLDIPSRMLYTYRLKDGDFIEIHVKEELATTESA